MTKHWLNNTLFWAFWVSVNAIASLIWGNILLTTALPNVAGMVVGILLFIVFYSLVDGYLAQHNHFDMLASLKMGVYIKAGLQLLNAAFMISPFIVPEVVAGIISLTMTQDWLHMSENHDPFWFSLANTLITGALLSLLVGLISGLVLLIRKQSSQPTTSTH